MVQISKKSAPREAEVLISQIMKDFLELYQWLLALAGNHDSKIEAYSAS